MMLSPQISAKASIAGHHGEPPALHRDRSHPTPLRTCASTFATLIAFIPIGCNLAQPYHLLWKPMTSLEPVSSVNDFMDLRHQENPRSTCGFFTCRGLFEFLRYLGRGDVHIDGLCGELPTDYTILNTSMTHVQARSVGRTLHIG